MSKQTHVCVFTSAHPYDDVRVYSRVARSFVDAGYAVSWVGPDWAMLNSQAEPDREIQYNLFRRNRTRGMRLLASNVAKKVALKHIRDVDWWYCPDPDAATAAEQLTRRIGGRMLFDIHEAFDKGMIDRWFGGHAPQLVKQLVRWRVGQICRRADIITGVNETVLHGYKSRTGKVVVTRLCAPAFFANRLGERPKESMRKLRVIHGKAIAGVGTEQVLDAVQRLRPEVRVEIEVTLIRMSDSERDVPEDISQRLGDLAAVGGPVEVIDRLQHAEMPMLLSRHRVGLIAYQRNLGVEALPNRFFEYMAAGLAIVAPNYSKEIVPIIEREKIGLLVDFEKPQEIAGALEWLVAHPAEVDAMGQRARQAFLTTYNWDKEFAKLLKAMQ